jgi:plasmid stabilization system protein ParE
MAKIEKIIWTDDGIKSFEDVVQYISNDSEYYASEFAKRILSSIEKLPEFPYIGRIVPEYNNPDLREIIYQNYRIVYKISGNAVYLLLVIHGGRQLPKIPM